jgi:hypothetical protein
MPFEIVGEIIQIETIAVGGTIRDLPRLRRLYGRGRWRKLKGIALVRLRTGRVRKAELHCMKRMASAGRRSGESAMSTRRRKVLRRPAARFVVCIENSGYPAALELHKIYRILPDVDAALDGDIRVVDESGEDYLYPSDWFAAVELPRRVKSSLLRRSAQIQSA